MNNNPYKEWTDVALKQATEQIDAVIYDRYQIRKMERVKSLNVHGITVKDFVVIYAPWREETREPSFSFYIVRDNKIYDLREDSGSWSPEDIYEYHPWWPILTDDDGTTYNGAYQFIPSGFIETCENCYEYSKDTQAALEVLKAHGFETLIEAKFEDQGCYDDVYKEWLKNENKP